ncbi:CDP-glucose 4,6-dehydratase [Pseudomonas sp. RIT-PI-AD]|uniref:CDP-glucose 4,6-dehydratase n=1 Tax=Pseudomonas sp. RIT-PI-AD TaxID=3035294 RepID=UPI0021DA51E7|nr:CDP-glucose 4,6-dehydratase [Pseudomonas sp. RIT-PI-AD]
MALEPEFWRGRRVFLTGHTGFKGGWLALWLDALGARTQGYALEASTEPALWRAARLDQVLGSEIGDIRDAQRLRDSLCAAQPEVVFHLAAQPLVRASYRDPLATYSTNVMGTAHLLEAVRACPSVRAVVVVTTDKCYENREWLWPYRESDSLGGHDPYSSSKACTELVCAAYRASFLAERGVALATARAGNVLGGGDWSADRLVPDVLRAWSAGDEVVLRHPQATRPWQHVLDPLAGYLQLAQALCGETPAAFAQGWNFGPDAQGVSSVATLVEKLAALWQGSPRWRVDAAPGVHEATLLTLDSSLARQRLGWQPHWTLEQALRLTCDWQRAWAAGEDMQAFSRRQIDVYQGEVR